MSVRFVSTVHGKSWHDDSILPTYFFVVLTHVCVNHNFYAPFQFDSNDSCYLLFIMQLLSRMIVFNR